MGSLNFKNRTRNILYVCNLLVNIYTFYHTIHKNFIHKHKKFNFKPYMIEFVYTTLLKDIL